MHCFAGCPIEGLLGAKGFTLGDLYADKRTMTPAIRRQVADEERLERVEHRLGLAIMAQAVLPAERNYWRAVEQNLFEQEQDLRSRIFPQEKAARERESEVRRIIREYGFEELWERLPMARLQARLMNERGIMS